MQALELNTLKFNARSSKIIVQSVEAALHQEDKSAIVTSVQISLSEQEFSAAEAEAKRWAISLSQLVRLSLRNLLSVDEDTPWMKYAGMIQSGNLNSSADLDTIVYGIKP